MSVFVAVDQIEKVFPLADGGKYIALKGIDLKSLALNCLVIAAHEEMHIVAGAGKACSVEGSQRASADNSNSSLKDFSHRVRIAPPVKGGQAWLSQTLTIRLIVRPVS